MHAFPTASGMSAVHVSSDMELEQDPHEPDVWPVEAYAKHWMVAEASSELHEHVASPAESTWQQANPEVAAVVRLAIV